MFLSDSTPPQPPAPLQRINPEPIGVNLNYTEHPEQIVLKIKENKFSWTGDDFSIYDISDNPFLQCKALPLSLHRKKEIYDNTGKLLFTISKKVMEYTFEGIAPDGETVLFTVTSSFSIGSAKLTTTFTNFDGQDMVLALRGEFFDRAAALTLNGPEGPPVGNIARSFFNMGQALFDQQSYYLTVAPGVDATLLAAICICLDEKENENRN